MCRNIFLTFSLREEFLDDIDVHLIGSFAFTHVLSPVAAMGSKNVPFFWQHG